MKTLREALEQLMQQHREAGSRIAYAELCEALKLPDVAPADIETSNYGCEVPKCKAHPSRGDVITRTSPKGGPFAGRCNVHMSWTPEPTNSFPDDSRN